MLEATANGVAVGEKCQWHFAREQMFCFEERRAEARLIRGYITVYFHYSRYVEYCQ